MFYIPAHQACTSLSDALLYLKHVQEDSIVLVSMPVKRLFAGVQQIYRRFLKFAYVAVWVCVCGEMSTHFV